ncbi:MAG: DUF4296 domain-containing protein [Ferruginibacter sp.]|nr:DUF4296 domain-containing protein [Cytophagales bacterium]
MKKYFLGGLLWTLGACVERPQPPLGTLSQSQMVQILTDVHLAEAKTSRITLRSLDSSRTLYQRYEEEILKNYRTDTATYRKSLRFYLENTGYLDEIYQTVVDTLSQREKQGRLK